MKKTPMLLRVNRAGEFTVYASVAKPTRCGTMETMKYKYFVTIEATNESLTPEGYVMENSLCDSYFQKTYTNNPEANCESCESMAQDAVEHFLKAFKKNFDTYEVQLRRIYVRIHGSDFSYIEAEWKSL